MKTLVTYPGIYHGSGIVCLYFSLTFIAFYLIRNKNIRCKSCFIFGSSTGASFRTKTEPSESLQKQSSVLAVLLLLNHQAARELPLLPDCSSRLSFILILNRVSCCFGKQITLSQQKGGWEGIKKALHSSRAAAR